MKKATITEFKNNLSALLAKAARGEEIVIYDRRKPYVRVVNLFHGSPSNAEAKDDAGNRLACLEADALVSRRKRDTLVEVLQCERPRAKASLLEALLEDRNRDL